MLVFMMLCFMLVYSFNFNDGWLYTANICYLVDTLTIASMRHSLKIVVYYVYATMWTQIEVISFGFLCIKLRVVSTGCLLIYG